MALSRRCEYLEIEPMRRDDLADVAGIEIQSFTTPWPMTAYQHELEANPNAAYFVARCRVAGGQSEPPAAPEHRLVGYAGLWALHDEAHISTIAVHPSWRGMGIGEALLIRLIEYALRASLSFITLEVRPSNGVAQHLYWKYGFVETGIRHAYYPDNREDAIIMSTPPLDDQGWRALFERRQRALTASDRWDGGQEL
jgi:ribosomal-protein-alanine N-acetyltransferase